MMTAFDDCALGALESVTGRRVPKSGGRRQTADAARSHLSKL